MLMKHFLVENMKQKQYCVNVVLYLLEKAKFTLLYLFLSRYYRTKTKVICSVCNKTFTYSSYVNICLLNPIQDKCGKCNPKF